jgi:hypothetical protein
MVAAGPVSAGETAPDPRASISSISFSMSGYANLARNVPRFQLGQVYLDGRGTIQKGGAMNGGTSTRNAYLEYPEATMQTQIIGWSYSAAPHGGPQELVLEVKVIASNDPVDCQVGTVGKVTLVDDNRRMKNGKRRDSITQGYPISACPSFIQGVSNKNAAHLEPTMGGPGGGQWAEVSISAS